MHACVCVVWCGVVWCGVVCVCVCVCVCVVSGAEWSWVIASTAVSSNGIDDRIAVI